MYQQNHATLTFFLYMCFVLWVNDVICHTLTLLNVTNGKQKTTSIRNDVLLKVIFNDGLKNYVSLILKNDHIFFVHDIFMWLNNIIGHTLT